MNHWLHDFKGIYGNKARAKNARHNDDVYYILEQWVGKDKWQPIGMFEIQLEGREKKRDVMLENPTITLRLSKFERKEAA